ncbi:hypothetical protein GCM10020358_66590 [Amorphoplanes nipponensis]|uniref:Uncharacterized protein n=1 Tax=Actinoplanes nipponensis TaxID=135950 RepID=A0A919JLC5_9ACTN|nr:hypothetical protein [Actinoplanes nipponensis]GIE51773.1 hypothetical protein Ani05nite_53070 [Actinoplanes nipponensis]
MSVLRWCGVLLVATSGLLLAGASPAAAHAGGLTATDARSRVVTVTPAVPGLAVTAIEDGARLRLRNGTPSAVTVPPGGGAATPAVVPPGGELTWADTRSTPDGRAVPPGGTQRWSLVLDAGGTPVTVTGELVGERPPAPAPWWAAVLVTAAAVPLVARRLRRPDLALTAAGLAAMAASVAHVAGSTLAVESAPLPGTFLSACGINLLNWPLIVGGAVAVLRGRPAGVLAICAGAALTAVFVLPDVTSLHRAVLPFAGPPVVERLLVVVTLGAGAGVAVAGASVLRRLAQRSPAEEAV